uniref:ISXO2-like transposase domain-containing protein n=1 Tax=Romanomermis culicivorax TaxID=13658 RepID=A0A915J3H4_ROMCU
MIHSDMWKANECLDENGYIHWTVDHSKEFVNVDTGVHTNAIESSWRMAKSSMSSSGRVKDHKAGNLVHLSKKIKK